MIPVVWLSFDEKVPARGYWDQGMIEALFNHELWRPNDPFHFNHLTSTEGLEGAVIVFPARSQVEYIKQLQQELEPLKWVLLILTGDEEASFPFDKLKHDNMKIWAMSPRMTARFDNVRKIGSGFPPFARELLTRFDIEIIQKPLDWFFAGQITHQRRFEMADQLNNLADNGEVIGEFHPSDGFTKGLPPEYYYKKLASARVVPSPSGPETPDSFRTFEALEAGAVPIVDTRTNKGDFPDNYWTWFFGEEPPFPVFMKYEQLPGYMLDTIGKWPRINNRVWAWWMKKKREMAYWLLEDLSALGVGTVDALQTDDDDITVLIPCSPIEEHPSTAMIEQTVGAIRTKLPNAEIIIMLDGVRPEQEAYRERYELYINRLLWLIHRHWHNVLPIIFDEHTHQASMTRKALEYVNTPAILFVEHDAPITPDMDFPWSTFLWYIKRGDANIIRFHHEAHILPEHEHLMLSDVKFAEYAPMRQTMQWSQRPHLASTEFYRHMLDTYFNPESKTMIEDVMHGIVIEECQRGGLQAWYNWRLWIYTPEGNIKHSYHLDGRGSDPKFEMDIKPVERAK